MSQLILVGLYESLALAIVDKVRSNNHDSIQIGGPIWLIHFFLNVTFESSLK